MTRRDIIAFEVFYATTLRREASSRRARYPAAAEQLERYADAADMRIVALRSGPLFDLERVPAPVEVAA